MNILKNSIQASLYEDYLRECELSEKTQRLYRNVAKDFCSNVDDLENQEKIIEYLIEKVHRQNNNYYKFALIHFLKWYFTGNKSKLTTILENIPSFKPQPSKRNTITLEPQKIMELIDNLNEDRHKVMSIIMMSTGIRIGDCLKIKRDNIILETYKDKPTLKIITIGKGNKQNIFYITIDWIIDLILNYKKDTETYTEYMFMTSKYRKNKNVILTSIEGDNDITKGDMLKKQYIKVLKSSDTIRSEPGTIININDLKIGGVSFDVKLTEELFEEDFNNKNIIWYNQNQIKYKSLFIVTDYHYHLYLHDVKQAQNKMGIPLDKWGAHDFRRCYAAKVWEMNKDIHVLMRQLNHARPETTIRYLKTSGLDRKDNDVSIQNHMFNTIT